MLRAAAREGRPYEVAILDLMMPEMDGIELAGSIYTDPALRNVRLIMLASGLTRRHDAAAAGIREYLTKPARQSLLFDAVANAAAVREPTRPVLAEPAPSPNGAAKGQGPPILVVEDNAVNQAVAEAMLARRGHPVDVAHDGLEAVEAIFAGRYAAVLMDCQMPEMDGYEATAEIRRREGDSAHIPIIAMTAHSMKGDRERCLAAGMDDYISKPLRADVLDATLARWLEGETGNEPSTEVMSAGNGVTDKNPIDIDTLDRLRSEVAGPGQEDALDPIIASFLESAPSRVAAIAKAVDSGEQEATSQAAHALKGASSTFGAVQLASICSALELAGREGDLEQARSLIPNLEEAAVMTQAALKGQMAGSAAGRR